MRLILASLFIAASLSAQGTKPRDFPAQYTAHTQLGNVWVGADFHGHYINTQKATYDTPKFLVVEVGFYAPVGKQIEIDPSQFVLNVNGRALTAQPPNLVSLVLKNPTLDEQNHLQTEAGIGPVVMTTGQPAPGPKFPGDRDPSDTTGRQPRVDTDPSRGTVDHQPVDPAEAVQSVSLEKGPRGTPVAGLLYFSWEGKLKKIKSLSLDYSSTLGTAKLELQ
jgi:hypothetical protein